MSWFEVNGYGCRATYPTNITQEIDPYRPLRPESVDGCLLDYYIIEIIQAGLQCLLAVSIRAKCPLCILYAITY